MSQQILPKSSFYFSTRNLLIMAVMAALGGVASTYINALSDIVQAALGFPGGSQWASGLHVMWIVLAMGIIGKPGTGITTGLLKGAVELMSGNSHGVIILLVNMVAGLLVDFGFLLFKNKRTLLPYLLAGGLATGSNVLVFQLFATIPLNILGISAILILFLVALISGVIFAGIIPFQLQNTLAKAGVIKTDENPNHNRKLIWLIFSGLLVLSALFAMYLRITYQGPPAIPISGAVNNAYQFPDENSSINTVTRKMDYRGVTTEYTGYPLIDIIQLANPDKNADTLLIEASDGYGFLIGFEELQSNLNILLVQQGQGKSAAFDVVGPESSKAWIRSVKKITLITTERLTITDRSGQTHELVLDDWVSFMDSTQIDLPGGEQKLQGIVVWRVVQAYIEKNTITEIVFYSPDESVTFNWADIKDNNDLSIYTLIKDDEITYLLAEMSGNILLSPLTGMEIN